jgi:hypothetical protein
LGHESPLNNSFQCGPTPLTVVVSGNMAHAEITKIRSAGAPALSTTITPCSWLSSSKRASTAGATVRPA